MAKDEIKMKPCRACGKDVEVGKACEACGWDEDKEMTLAKQRRLERQVEAELDAAEKKEKEPKEKKGPRLPFSR